MNKNWLMDLLSKIQYCSLLLIYKIWIIASYLFYSHTDIEPECEKSSATTYYWYREALDITSSISESGGLNWKMTVCLLAAWVMVCLAMIKGIQSSGKVSMLESLLIRLSTRCGYYQSIAAIPKIQLTNCL